MDGHGVRVARINAAVVLYAVPLVAGAFIGYRIAWSASRGGMGGPIEAGLLLLACLGVLVALAVVGLVLRAWPGGRGRGLARALFVSGGVAVAAGLAAYVITPLAGLGYREPVVLATSATMSIRMDDVPMFTSEESGEADCWSVPDSTAVASVTGLDLGELRGGTLRATLSLGGPDGSATGDVGVEAWIDGGDLPPDAVQPVWVGTATASDRADGDRSGRAQFSLRLRAEPALGAPSAEWPEAIAGELSWSCAEWSSGRVER